jgi:hypothetical protein
MYQSVDVAANTGNGIINIQGADAITWKMRDILSVSFGGPQTGSLHRAFTSQSSCQCPRRWRDMQLSIMLHHLSGTDLRFLILWTLQRTLIFSMRLLASVPCQPLRMHSQGLKERRRSSMAMTISAHDRKVVRMFKGSRKALGQSCQEKDTT